MEIQKNEVIKIPYLDGLRGIAALMVFLGHLMISLFPAVVTFSKSEMHTKFDVSIGLSPLSFLWGGNFAVCIFFVLSGFVLSEFCQVTKISFLSQILRRYCRLSLPMLLTSTFAWILLYYGAYSNIKAAPITHSGWLSMWYQFSSNFFKMADEALYSAFIQGYSKYNCNLWTMKIELIGSIYIFALHALFKNKIMRLFIIIGFFLLNFSNLHNYYLLFAIGAFLFDFHKLIEKYFQKILPKSYLYIVILGFFIGLYLGAFPDSQSAASSIWYTWFTKSKNAQGWHMLGSFLLVMFILQWPFIQFALSCRMGRFLGKISFVLYLIHIPILCSITSWIIIITQHLPYLFAASIAAFITFLIVIGLSTIMYRYIDLHTTIFSRWAGKTFDVWIHKINQSILTKEETIKCLQNS